MSAPIKPQLRGVLHQISFFVALAAGTWLLTRASGAMFWACLVYLVALCGQLAVSALYHRVTWDPRARQWWRRLDHSFIMILIAGTGTPLAVALPTDATHTLLFLLWGGAALGVLRALVWITAPKPLVAMLALALAWFSSPFMPVLGAVMGTTSLVWLLVGGVIYSLGAVAYALKRPDPWPAVFGYHEVFHTLVVVGAACHFVTVTRVVLGLAESAGSR
jgi:hemolysin III